MNKRVIIRSTLITSMLLTSVLAGITTSVYAVPSSNSTANGNNVFYDQPGSSNKTEIEYESQYKYESSNSESGGTYESKKAGENVILALDGSINFSKSTINKTGDIDANDNADFYGINAAVLSTGTSKIKLMGSAINTNAKHANAAFAYGDSTIDVSDTIIRTLADNSGGLMVAGGGTLIATNVAVETDGVSSAPIRSDRGGGEMTINGGTYKSNGAGSPVIYSTANVTVKGKAELESTVSEGVVIEGANSVSIEDSKLIANNTKLHGNSQTYKSIFIYQSGSSDAKEGLGRFSSTKSSIDTRNGDTFFITNTSAMINVEKTSFTYGNDTTAMVNGETNKHALLRAASGKWGKRGKNGGNVTFMSKKNPLYGDIVLDGNSTADVSFLERTQYLGAINGNKQAKKIVVSLDKTSRIILAGDSYVSELKNTVSDNSNIYANGHKLFVNGSEVSINQDKYEPWEYDFETETTEPVVEVKEAKKDKTSLYILLVVTGTAFILALASVFAILKKNKRKKQKRSEKEAVEKAKKNSMKKPWERA